MKIKFFDLSLIIHTTLIFKDCSQLLTFCLRSSKFNFCYAVLGMLSLRCVVNNPLYYGHRSLGSAFSGCLQKGDLSHIPKTKIVDADHYLRVFFSHSKGKGYQAIVEQFLGQLPQYKAALRGTKKLYCGKTLK